MGNCCSQWFFLKKVLEVLFFFGGLIRGLDGSMDRLKKVEFKVAPSVLLVYDATIQSWPKYHDWVVATQRVFLICTPKIGEDSQVDEHIFQRGWNHQLDDFRVMLFVAYHDFDRITPQQCHWTIPSWSFAHLLVQLISFGFSFFRCQVVNFWLIKVALGVCQSGKSLLFFFWGWGFLPSRSSCFFQNRFIGIPKKPRNCDVILAVWGWRVYPMRKSLSNDWRWIYIYNKWVDNLFLMIKCDLWEKNMQ